MFVSVWLRESLFIDLLLWKIIVSFFRAGRYIEKIMHSKVQMLLMWCRMWPGMFIVQFQCFSHCLYCKYTDCFLCNESLRRHCECVRVVTMFSTFSMFRSLMHQQENTCIILNISHLNFLICCVSWSSRLRHHHCSVLLLHATHTGNPSSLRSKLKSFEALC